MKQDLPEAVARADSQAQADASVSNLSALLAAQREAYLRAPFPAWSERARHLRALRDILFANQDALADAMNADFGQRSRAEVALAEFLVLKQEIDSALRHGERWMRVQRRRAGKWLMPGRARVVPQPIGVAGIVVPWNYPLQLAAGPLVCALAAGCRAMIKMSELTPLTSALFADLIAQTFAPDHVTVVNGDAAVGAAFTALPFDHLLFTGSTRIGHEVMRAAAANLTPVTLELGGKSPALIGEHARFDYAVDSLLLGKTLNAGQTCIAPDYVLLPRGKEDAFIARARVRFNELYPDFANNRDYTSIISTRHYERLERLADEAQAEGAQLHALGPRNAATRQFAPVLVTGASAHTQLMQEEIFGPLLPIVPYDSLDEALRYVNARARPLALYLYADDARTVDRVTHETIAGGMSVNETLMHIAAEGLPFGGVGASGMGSYHGYEGFCTFSKMKPVFTQARLNGRHLIAPPYGKLFNTLIRVMLKF